MCESKFRMPGGGGGGGGGVRRGTAFPCASAATLPKTRAFACGAGNGAAATTAAHLPLLSYLPAYSSCPPCPPLSILCLSLSIPPALPAASPPTVPLSSCLTFAASPAPIALPTSVEPERATAPGSRYLRCAPTGTPDQCCNKLVTVLRTHRNTPDQVWRPGSVATS